MSFDSCVRGQVTDADGAPVADATVFLVPGETTTTDENGNYCGRAPINTTVYAFVAGQQSVAVETNEPGDCPDTCFEANLRVVAAPSDGDDVGVIIVEHSVSEFCPVFARRGFNQAFVEDRFDVFGVFVAIDLEALEDADFPVDTCGEPVVEMIGGCEVTTFSCEVPVNGELPEDDLTGLLGNVAGLDPGAPGTAESGKASTDLLPGDPTSISPPVALLASIFTPPFEVDLREQGFGPGQTVELSWPGGADIGAFSTTIDVPPAVEEVTPDSCSFVVDPSADLEVTWAPAKGFSGNVVVELCSGRTTFTETTTSIEEVCVVCEFPDSDGSGTIPAAALAALPGAGEGGKSFGFTDLVVFRETTQNVNVPLVSGGQGVVRVFAGSSRDVSAFDGGPVFAKQQVEAELGREIRPPSIRFIPGSRSGDRRNRRAGYLKLRELAESSAAAEPKLELKLEPVQEAATR